MDNIPKLTDLDFAIMEVMWDSGKNMTIQQITDNLEEQNLSTASVAQVVRRLLKKKVITQMESVLVSNVYARTFRACISREEVVSARVRELEGKMGAMGLMAAFLKHLPDDEAMEKKGIEEVEQLLKARKEKLQ